MEHSSSSSELRTRAIISPFPLKNTLPTPRHGKKINFHQQAGLAQTHPKYYSRTVRFGARSGVCHRAYVSVCVRVLGGACDLSDRTARHGGKGEGHKTRFEDYHGAGAGHKTGKNVRRRRAALKMKHKHSAIGLGLDLRSKPWVSV